MAEADTLRTVTLTRTGEETYRATNVRGGVLDLGSAGTADFTPVELLLVAIGGCSGIDVELITGKRAEPTAFDVTVEGHKTRDEQGNRMTGLRVTFDVTFPDGDAGDRAREVLPRAIEQSRDRLCTVSRTVAVASPVEMSAR